MAYRHHLLNYIHAIEKLDLDHTMYEKRPLTARFKNVILLVVTLIYKNNLLCLQ